MAETKLCIFPGVEKKIPLPRDIFADGNHQSKNPQGFPLCTAGCERQGMCNSAGFVPVRGKNRVTHCIFIDFSFNWMFLLKNKSKGGNNGKQTKQKETKK